MEALGDSADTPPDMIFWPLANKVAWYGGYFFVIFASIFAVAFVSVALGFLIKLLVFRMAPLVER